MTRSLDDDLHLLRQRILRMGGMVEEATANATAALTQRRPELARRVLEADDAIDMVELDVDEECLRILALHQPVASDLRYITAVLKINNDLERIGDLACNVAERAIDLSTRDPLVLPMQFERMTEIVRAMLHDALDALVSRNAELARDVCARDREVNAIHRENFAILQECMKGDVETVERCVDLLSASRQLERMADQTTNIAEDVVFLVEGLVIRHRKAQQRAQAGETDRARL
ncbi:MAG TPA: phosphate signaling complex protein PhoU [Planctomycetota bacterium]|nr:phosphate signaling complex protein PhoU [Planctomycetota bacterium]